MNARSVVLTVVLAVAACDGTGAYVYYARRYDEPRDCLDKVEALDVMSGTDPGVGCAARCLSVKDFDGAVSLYGTTTCGPAPFGANSNESDPRCAAVRAAVTTSNVCKPDSGIKDAGADAPVEAEVDAAIDVAPPVDAGADVASDVSTD